MNFFSPISPFSTWAPDLEGPQWDIVIQTGIESLDAKIEKIFKRIDFLDTFMDQKLMYQEILYLNKNLQMIDINSLQIKTYNITNKESFIYKLKSILEKIKTDSSLKEIKESEISNKLFNSDFFALLSLLDQTRESANPKYIVDDTNGDLYLNEDPLTIRAKCGALAIASPVAHLLAPLIITKNHLMEGDYSKLGEDLVRVAVTPLTIVSSSSAALFGVISPWDGRKFYARIENLVYDEAILAPCFQPDATEHFCGGDIEEQGAW